MTTLRQAAQQALDALCDIIPANANRSEINRIQHSAIAALREALAQPEQEPVAWAVQACSKMWRGEFAEIDAKAEAKRIGGTCVAYPLYTAAAQRPWQGLTDEDKQTAVWTDGTFGGGALWAQQLLKERNE